MQKSIFSKTNFLSGSALKLIAIISMFIDHIALLFYSDIEFLRLPFFTLLGKTVSPYYLMRLIGRLAFPIFSFLIVEGVIHTKNIKKYISNLLIFAILSEIPFDYMINGTPFLISKQNVYFTLALGVFMILIFQRINNEFIKGTSMIALSVLTVILRVDYGLRGVLLILLLYILKESYAAKTVLSYPLLSGGPAAFVAFIPINMYNGKRGFVKSSVLKYTFYLFYPLHIILLIIVKLTLF